MTVSNVTNGCPFYNFYDSIESKIISDLSEIEKILEISKVKRNAFKKQCKDNYEEYFTSENISTILCKHDAELVNIITGIYTLAFNFKGKYNKEIKEDCRKLYGITKCCATIINVHQQGGTSHADTYDLKKFFEGTEFDSPGCEFKLINIHQAIDNFIDWQTKENLMINVSGLPYLRWPEWLPKTQKCCNCHNTSRSGANKHIYSKILTMTSKVKE